jgi:hypothetical protein
VDGFQISTMSGKKGVPDGFIFDFDNKEWGLIECELLEHGVWPHIAEQITRFVVALQNPDTLRELRERLFEFILENKLVTKIASSLNTTPERLHQQLELFLEAVDAQIIIFIDDTNKDLHDMAQALDVPTKIFRVKKLIVDGKTDYYSPDRKVPVIDSEPSEEGPSLEYDVIELLGGGQLKAAVRRFKCYTLLDGSVVYVKISKCYPSNDYWYGIGTSSLEYIDEYDVTHIIFVMGDFGFVKVPISIVKDFLKNTATSKNPDGSIRHYHCFISGGPEPILYHSNDRPKFELKEYFQPFD